jgi:2-polyprenyl-3-methyl-5-hydroxy-6-metoxy-1,4-benzoquinol methylase
MACKKLNFCLCCKSNKLKGILNLNKQPLANSFLKSLNEKEKKYPLAVNACLNCTHLQLTHIVSPTIIYKNYDYVSGTTKTYLNYMKDFFFICKKNIGLKKPNSVLDIGCNDGSQLDVFKKKGFITCGIDPARNIYKISKKKHKIFCNFFDEKFIKRINKKFDIIISQNSFAHNPNPSNFLKNVKKIMHNKSILVIQTSQANMCKNNEFDTIYHEHINFFNIKSMKILVERNGLYLSRVIKNKIHGTSYIFIIKKYNQIDKNLNKQVRNEKYLNINYYKKWSKNCFNNVRNLKKILNSIPEKFKKVGYGAAAKSNTFLNFSKIKLNFIIDDNTFKQNKFTPGQKIPIFSIKELSKYKKIKKIFFIPLAWNFFDEIKNKIQKFRKSNKDLFIKFHPHVEITR